MKQLISPGVYEYSLDSIKDATEDADNTSKRYNDMMNVLSDGKKYH